MSVSTHQCMCCLVVVPQGESRLQCVTFHCCIQNLAAVFECLITTFKRDGYIK